MNPFFWRWWLSIGLTSILVATQEPTSYSIGGVGAPGPVTPAIFSDLDRDGRPDIVTGYLPTKEVWTRRNSGSGAIYEGSLIYALADEPTLAGHGPFDGLHAVPSIVILDREGREVHLHVGAYDQTQLDAALASVGAR